MATSTLSPAAAENDDLQALLRAMVAERDALRAERDALQAEAVARAAKHEAAMAVMLIEKDALERALIASERQRKLETAALRSELEALKRRIYGPKSEKIDSNQLGLAFEAAVADVQIAIQEPPVPVVRVKPETKATVRPRRFQDLPVKVTLLDVPERERTGLEKMRDEVTEKLERQPGHYYINRIVRPVYGDPRKLQAPVIAALPAQVLPQSGLGTTVISHALVGKYVDHLPLYRQSKIAAREGITLEPQKLARGIEAAAQLLITIRDQLAGKIRGRGYLQADETPVNVMDEDRPGKVRQAWLWAYHSPPERTVVFDFSRSRGRDSPANFIPLDWTGVLQTDGWETYASLLRERPNATHVACWAHARRYVHEALQAGDESADVIHLLADIGRLYAVEADAREMPPEDREQSTGSGLNSLINNEMLRQMA